MVGISAPYSQRVGQRVGRENVPENHNGCVSCTWNELLAPVIQSFIRVFHATWLKAAPWKFPSCFQQISIFWWPMSVKLSAAAKSSDQLIYIFILRPSVQQMPARSAKLIEWLEYIKKNVIKIIWSLETFRILRLLCVAAFCLGAGLREAPRRIARRPPRLPIFHTAPWKELSLGKSQTSWNNAFLQSFAHLARTKTQTLKTTPHPIKKNLPELFMFS